MKLHWNSDKSRPWYKRIAVAMWSLTALALLFGVVLFAYLANDNLPSFEDLENPKYDLASIVYANDGTPFGKYYIENREVIPYDSLSPHIVRALLAVEDARFHRHAGIDLRALGRVAVKTVLLGNADSGGGSTITQQLSKLLFDRPNLRGKGRLYRAASLVKVKLKEWITAVKLERSYTKEEIMAMYLNKFEFINGAHGIQAAAQTYFGRDQRDLKIDEAATLVGMLKNPALFNPKRFPDKSIGRRNLVLRQMHRRGHLDDTAFDTLSHRPMDMSRFNRDNHSEGPAPHFRAELTKWLRQLLAQEEFQKSDGGTYNIYKDGLQIHTTIDLAYQQHAEAAVVKHMQWNQERYWRAWRGMNIFAFEADQRQRAIRKQAFQRRVIASDRYQRLFARVVAPFVAEVKEKYNGIVLKIRTIEELIDAKNAIEEARHLADSGDIEAGQLSDFVRFLNSEDWATFKTKWAAFEQAYDSEFNTEIPMKVFNYSEGLEEERDMTPMDSVMYHYKHLQAGLLAVEPGTGHIKAWVGGVDHRYFKYDHINMRRQVGSTIKPFVYATAIAMQGISPCQEYDDIQYTIAPGDANFGLQDEWTPANANGIFTGNRYNLYQGLLYSKNSITVRLVKEMGSVEVLRELLHNVGIEKDLTWPNGEPVVPSLPAISLGAVDLTVQELTGAYTTFANNGIYNEPVFVSHIADKNGKVIYRASPTRRLAINPVYNSVMLDMLRNNTGGNFGMGIKSDNGGKTGTTNDYADAWFMGITPTLVVGTWVGGEDKWIRFYTLDDGQGFVMARPIFQDFMKRLEGDEESGYDYNVRFPAPPPEAMEYIDCAKYKNIKPEEERSAALQRRVDRDEFEEEFDEEIEEEFDEEEGF